MGTVPAKRGPWAPMGLPGQLKLARLARTHFLLTSSLESNNLTSKIADTANLSIEEVACADLYRLFSNLKSYQP